MPDAAAPHDTPAVAAHESRLPPPAQEGSEVSVDGFFGAVIIRYSRADALADGVLADVSGRASEAGFSVPVALSAALWADINAIPEGAGQDVDGRLWDVLFLAWHNVRVHGNQPGNTLVYKLILPVQGADERPGAPYAVKCVIGPGDDGEPVLTFLRPDED